MVVVPAATAVTKPEPEIVATPVLDDVHGVVASGVADPVSDEVLPTHAFKVPVMAGKGFTCTLTLLVLLQPVAVLVVVSV